MAPYCRAVSFGTDHALTWTEGGSRVLVIDRSHPVQLHDDQLTTWGFMHIAHASVWLSRHPT